MFSTLYGTYFPFSMHFKISSAIWFNLDQSKVLLFGNGLRKIIEPNYRNTEVLVLTNPDGCRQTDRHIHQSVVVTVMSRSMQAGLTDAGKGGNAGNQHFLFFLQGFLPYRRQISCFEPHFKCHLQMHPFRTRLNFWCVVKSEILSNKFTFYFL